MCNFRFDGGEFSRTGGKEGEFIMHRGWIAWIEHFDEYKRIIK